MSNPTAVFGMMAIAFGLAMVSSITMSIRCFKKSGEGEHRAAYITLGMFCIGLALLCVGLTWMVFDILFNNPHLH